MTDIAIGVLIPVNIRGEHNEIIDIWITSCQPYYYQEGIEEGLYYGEGFKVPNYQDDDELIEKLYSAVIKINLN
tara:strand:- start:635 stop:856 length:222 start_codon:yes stop_codon:yes gene_type:complete